MAKVVLGLATSHSPQVSIPASEWPVLREKDENDGRLDYKGLCKIAKPNIETELTMEKMEARHQATKSSVSRLSKILNDVAPDVVVVVGDDQHEQFHDDVMPMFTIYHGESLHLIHKERTSVANWKHVEEKNWAQTAAQYPTRWELAQHLINALTLEEFDVTRSNQLRKEVGIGHAFAFLYRRIAPDSSVPMVPIMVNTYYPPNQPTPKRCYGFGQALRRAIESWNIDARVAILASGGLSHIIMDEELDRVTIDALTKAKRDQLFALPREKLKGGTSEILNWVIVAGAMSPQPMTLVDYIPGYRSPGATGCGMGFGYWPH
jgi:Catalytic LigB subunit of aromatic ring-opening dioxygenase